MLTLRNVPNATDNDFWEHGSEGKSMHYVLWPADVGAKLVTVKISPKALSEYDGETFELNTGKTEAALKRHRELIQQLAQSKYREGNSDMALDVGDFPARS